MDNNMIVWMDRKVVVLTVITENLVDTDAGRANEAGEIALRQVKRNDYLAVHRRSSIAIRKREH
jgi:hypothetical protein